MEHAGAVGRDQASKIRVSWQSALGLPHARWSYMFRFAHLGKRLLHFSGPSLSLSPRCPPSSSHPVNSSCRLTWKKLFPLPSSYPPSAPPSLPSSALPSLPPSCPHARPPACALSFPNRLLVDIVHSLASFLGVAEGLLPGVPAGVEEVTAIAALQALLGPENAHAKLVRLPQARSLDIRHRRSISPRASAST